MHLAKFTLYVPYFKMQEHGNQFSEIIQFICLGSLAFVFILQCIKESIRISACFPTVLSKFLKVNDFLRNYLQYFGNKIL